MDPTRAQRQNSEEIFPRRPERAMPSASLNSIRLLEDESITIKAYVTTLVKTLEVRKTQNEVAGVLVRWLDKGAYSATPILPAYRIINYN